MRTLLALLLVAAGCTQGAPVPGRIVVADDASVVERWSASKLSELLKLSAPSDSTATEGAQIAVGYGAAVALGMDAEALAGLSDDAYVVVAEPASGIPAGSVAIASSAGSARGTMNGAYAFLRVLGIEVLAQSETIVPAGAPQIPAGLNLAFDPPFESRDLAAVPTAGPGGKRGKSPGHGMSSPRLATNLSASLGFDGNFAFGPVGGKLGLDFTGAYNLLSPSGSTRDCGPGKSNATSTFNPCPAQATADPEWFACMAHNPDATAYPYGNHVNTQHTQWPCPLSMLVGTSKGQSQPCWSNASLIATMVSNIHELVQKYPQTRRISLAGLDGTSTFIQCPSDVPYMKAANSTGGGAFFAANEIAKALADTHPDLVLIIQAYPLRGNKSAYLYEMLQFPPKQGFKFHHNVGVQVCLTSEMGYDGYGGLPKSLPLTDPQNSHWLKRLMRWKELTSHVYIWEYTQAAPWAAPMPDYFVVAENLATLHKLGATGWFAESTCCHPREEMVELKVYLWGRLSFDPTLNISHVTENFLSGFYGASVAPHVMKYLQVLDAAMRARGAGRTGDPRIWPTNSKAKRMASKWAWGPFAAMFSNATVLDAATALKLAAATAEPGSRYSVRVAQAKTALQLVAFYRWDEFKAYSKASGRAWPFAAELSKEFEEFVSALRTPSRDGPAVTTVAAALAVDGSPNKGGSVTFEELQAQLGI